MDDDDSASLPSPVSSKELDLKDSGLDDQKTNLSSLTPEETKKHIKKLQAESSRFESDYKNLQDTLEKTVKMVSSGSVNATDPMLSDVDKQLISPDFKNIFENCNTGLGVVALDCRFLDCNKYFLQITGYSRYELMNHSLFNFVSTDTINDVYDGLGKLLKGKRNENNPVSFKMVPKNPLNDMLLINITMNEAQDGTPKYFNLTLLVREK